MKIWLSSILALCASCAPAVTPAVPRAVSIAPLAPPPDALSAQLLALHNAERARVGVPALAWDPMLAAASAAYASELAAYGRLRHSEQATRPGQGENLWMGTRRAFAVPQMMSGWLGERAIFRPGLFPDVSTNGNWAAVGHYTQIIWRGTTNVGCAIRSSARDDYLVCRYSPPGNVIGSPVP